MLPIFPREIGLGYVNCEDQKGEVKLASKLQVDEIET